MARVPNIMLQLFSTPDIIHTALELWQDFQYNL